MDETTIQLIKAEQERILAKGNPSQIIGHSATGTELLGVAIQFARFASTRIRSPKANFHWAVEDIRNMSLPGCIRPTAFDPSEDPQQVLIQAAAWLGLAMDKFKEEAASKPTT